MAASTSTVALPAPPQIAQAIAHVVPGELSKSPLLGILGVIMGAGIVTLTGRMLTLGLADLKGHVGIGFDSGAWISSAYNVALMFIGPFTVYLGALMGPRRILFFAATAFTAICALLPLIHSYSLLIVALVLAGLASGTFYPLTLTFALRNIPLRFLPFTIALYATSVDGAVNIAPSLYGWYREHLSWEWMFWNSAVITPLMAACIYFGIPAAPTAKKSSAPPSFAGFLYASAGFAMLFAAIDQGERLDWWRSGVFTALFVGGSFLLLCSLVRRLRSANPLVDLPYLRHWNTLLLGLALIIFRFNLLSTIVLIPQTLAIHGFEADQIGPAVIWSAVPLLPLAFAAGICRWALPAGEPRLSLAPGSWICVHGIRGLFECPNHQRVVGLELLPYRVASGRRTVVRVHRPGRSHYPARGFFRRSIEAAMDSDVLRVFPHRSLVRRTNRSGLHGPLPCRTRETSLEPAWSARGARELDH